VRASRVAAAVLLAALASCRQAAPDPAPRLDERSRYACCNLHYEDGEASDANYWVGSKIPAGTPVRLEDLKPHSVLVVAGESRITLKHEYGTKQESFEEYLEKLFVPYDPKRRMEQFPKEVRRAIDSGKVERGMTREQVLLSLGHPPTHRTPSLDALEWTYWYNRWVTYRVLFDQRGKVTAVVGRPAPTAEVAITNADPLPPKPGKSKKKK
jgi:SmpA/OmlA family protein